MPGMDRLYTDHLPARTLILDNREYLFFSGTAYLGTNRNREFQELVWEGMSRYGTNFSSSRNSNLKLQIFEEAEDYLRSYTGAEAALTMSSGYLAGQTLVKALAGGGQMIYAPGTHPALWQEGAEVPQNETYESWVENLLAQAPDMPGDHLILLSNSVDPLQVRQFDFDWVRDLAPGKQITLVVDDSHGFGLTGPDGAGIYSRLRQLAGVRVLVVSSLGKALGIPAGFILGDRETLARIQAGPNFGGASPAIPAYLYAFLQGARIFREARATLLANIQLFRHQACGSSFFQTFDNYPVFYTRREDLGPYLFQNQVVISAFPYPTPSHPLVTRVVLSSLHQAGDIRQLAALINQFAATHSVGR